MSFPKDFVWGAAAAAHQIEGARDKRGKHVWDMFCEKDDTVWNKQNGDVACDHYHRYEEDVALMGDLGLKAYRMSISWPRVLPDGIGAINADGLAFYDRLVDRLLARGIKPWITLFHWDLPLALYRTGCWNNRDIASAFGDYAGILADRLGDRVSHWMTFNEPQCFIGLGSHQGGIAPGDKLSIAETLNMSHNMLLAHGKAIQALRARCKIPTVLGYAPMANVLYPAKAGAANEAAAIRAMLEIKSDGLWNNTWWMDPVYLGHYPEEGLVAYGANAPKVLPGDFDIIHQPLDFAGVNIYFGTPVIDVDGVKTEKINFSQGFPITSCVWQVVPEALYWGPKFLWERYKLPVVITENGLTNPDWVSLDGKVHDPQRIDFTQRYLRELRRASDDGIKVAGYFYWSIMDNFEWSEGYKHRFGLIHVDYPSQRRTPKDSYYWYQEVIRTNGENL